ncbi:hypothetical protein DITRI_Ditri09bG0060100 [Diplodiscus trichospermus]
MSSLDITGVDSLKEMPNGIGQLYISELPNVNEVQYAKEANLYSKHELNDLELQWRIDFNESLRKKDVKTEVLNLLQPHKRLNALAIKCYAGLALPFWIENPSFRNLQSLKFIYCRNCIALPVVGKLPLLKDLHIEGMSSITSVGNEFYGENLPNVFPSLETLHFKDMPKWELWKACEGDEQGAKFHCLQELLILNCPTN